MNMIPRQLDLTCSRMILRFMQRLSFIVIIVLLIKGPASKKKKDTLQMKLAALALSFPLHSFTSSSLLLGSLPLLSYHLSFLSFGFATSSPLPNLSPNLPHPSYHVLSSSTSSGLSPDRQLTTDCPPIESEVATGRLAESVLLIYIEMSHIFPGYCG